MKPAETYHLTLRSEPGFRGEPIARLRALLKVCLRTFGLRVVEARIVPAEDKTEPKDRPQ